MEELSDDNSDKEVKLELKDLLEDTDDIQLA